MLAPINRRDEALCASIFASRVEMVVVTVHMQQQMWGCVLVAAETGRHTRIDTWLPGSPTCTHPNTHRHLPQTSTVSLPVYSLCPMAFLISLWRTCFPLNSFSSLFHLLPSLQCRPCRTKPSASSHWPSQSSIHSRRKH